MQVATGWQICLWLGLVFSSYCTNSRYCLDVSSCQKRRPPKASETSKLQAVSFLYRLLAQSRMGSQEYVYVNLGGIPCHNVDECYRKMQKHFKMLHRVFIRSHNQHSSTFWTLALLILSVFVHTGHSLIQRQLRKRCFNIASLGKHEDPKKPSVWDVCRDSKLTKAESKALAHF